MQTTQATCRTRIALALAAASIALAACDPGGSPAPTAPPAAASRATGRSQGATIVLGTSACGVIDSNANCVATPFRAVVTSSAQGVEIEQFATNGVFNDTGHAVVFTFADFGPPFGFCVSEVTGAVTTDWVEALSASGHASIVCRFRS